MTPELYVKYLAAMIVPSRCPFPVAVTRTTAEELKQAADDYGDSGRYPVTRPQRVSMARKNLKRKGTKIRIPHHEK